MKRVQNLLCLSGVALLLASGLAVGSPTMFPVSEGACTNSVELGLQNIAVLLADESSALDLVGLDSEGSDGVPLNTGRFVGTLLRIY